jgi:hypothetical protein
MAESKKPHFFLRKEGLIGVNGSVREKIGDVHDIGTFAPSSSRTVSHHRVTEGTEIMY